MYIYGSNITVDRIAERACQPQQSVCFIFTLTLSNKVYTHTNCATEQAGQQQQLRSSKASNKAVAASNTVDSSSGSSGIEADTGSVKSTVPDATAALTPALTATATAATAAPSTLAPASAAIAAVKQHSSGPSEPASVLSSATAAAGAGSSKQAAGTGTATNKPRVRSRIYSIY
jgi:hypothetical protein